MPGPVVADMFCLLRLELELSVQARARFLAQEGADSDHAVQWRLERLSGRNRLLAWMGTTRMLALEP